MGCIARGESGVNLRSQGLPRFTLKAADRPHQPLPSDVRPVVHPLKINLPDCLIRTVNRASQIIPRCCHAQHAAAAVSRPAGAMRVPAWNAVAPVACAVPIPRIGLPVSYAPG